MLVSLHRDPQSESWVPRSEQRTAPLRANLPASPASCISLPVCPSNSIPLLLPGKGQVSSLSPCPRFSCCLLDSGCCTPSHSPTKPLLLVMEWGWGRGRLRCVPRIPIRRRSMFTLSAGGETVGSACCDTPHTGGGNGEGEVWPCSSPQEQRVSVAHDSSKETQENKCATNRWGGYLGKDAAGRAASPFPSGLAGGKGLGLAPPALGQSGDCNEARLSWVCMSLRCCPRWGQHPYGCSKGTSGLLCWVSPPGKWHRVQGAACCLLALPLLPPPLTCHRPQLFFFFFLPQDPKELPWGVLSTAQPQGLMS